MEAIGKLQGHCISHVLQCLAGMHERMHNFYMRRAEYLCRSFIIVHTERGHAVTGIFYSGEFGILAEVSVTEQILQENFQIPRNPGGTEHEQTECTRLFFLHPCTRAWERG